MKKIAIISDIHSHQGLFEAVLNEVDDVVDEYIFLGDYITDGPNANEVLRLVQKYGDYIIAGNREVDLANYDGYRWHERVRYKSKEFTYRELSKASCDFIKKLPIYQIIEAGNKRICLAHGSPYDVREAVFDKSYALFDKLIADFACDVYLFGHQHRPFQIKYRGCWFINPGSVNTPLDQRATSKYGILTIDDEITYEAKEIVYDWDAAAEYYINSDYLLVCPEWANLLIYVLRDGIDYRKLFVEKLLATRNDATVVCRLEWHRIFQEFMNEWRLAIITGENYYD